MSREETIKHINRVKELTSEITSAIERAADRHDQSKLQEPEASRFDSVTGSLKDLTYGSPEYIKSLRNIRPALKHHYENNRHHPEYWADGVDDMTLVDIIEMLCDWKAAGERHTDGCIYKSLRINKTRFKIGDQLYDILKNTVDKYLKD